MLYETLKKPRLNIFTLKGKIPLGINSYKGIHRDPENKIISLPYERYSGALGIIGESGTGKTVIAKRVYSYLLGFYQAAYKRKRPGLIFDMQSEDHHLSRFPNSGPKYLFYEQGERPIGFDNLICFAPVFIQQESHFFDKPFGFSIEQFDYRDFLSLGMGAGASKMLEQLIKENMANIKEIKKFFEAILELPVNKTELQRLPSDYPFKLQNHKNYSSKQSLVEAFTPAFNDGVFINPYDGRCMNKFILELVKGHILVVNFHQEERYYAIYAGKILKDLYLARRASKRKEDKGERGFFPPPILVVEEADKLVPIETSGKTSGAAYWLLEILKRGRKYDFMTVVITQEASAMSERIRDHTRQWIIGKLAANDYQYFSSFLSQEAMNAIRSLDKSKHEFCMIYGNNEFDTFYAWDSPLEINRETAMRQKAGF